MPTYEYACKDCGEHLEVVQSFKDDALTTCPSCQGPLRKVFSAAGIIFKGSGWHIKDYKDTGAKPAAASSGSSDTTSDSDASSSSADTSSGDTGSDTTSGSDATSSGSDAKSA